MKVEVTALDLSHVDEIMTLRRYALSHLNDPDDYVLESDERHFVERHLGPAGISIGFRINHKLCGYSALTTDIYKYGDKDEIAPLITNSEEKWGALAATVLAPETRGLGLQQKAIRLRKQFAKEIGLTHLGVVVSTKNLASLLNLIQEGIILEKIIKFDDSRIRYLLSMETWNKPNTYPEINVTSPLNENELINRLLSKGYLGHQIISFPHGQYIGFSKRRESDD